MGSVDKRIHEPNIRRKRLKYWLNAHGSSDLDGFKNELSNILAKTNYSLITVVIRKDEYQEEFEQKQVDMFLPISQYHIALDFVLERFVHYLHYKANDAEGLARIHRRTALGTAPEEARGCSSESGIMVLEQKPARKQGAPNRCCHRTNPTVSASSLTTIAWWPMPACSCRPPWPGTWACENSSTITLTSAARRDGRTLGTRC